MKSLLLVTTTLMCYSLYADSSTSDHKNVPPCPLNECFARGDAALTNGCPSGYNTPAQVHLVDRNYQGFFTLSYLYWNAQQEGMDVARSATLAGSFATPSGETLFHDFDYNSGFKIGLGVDFEECDNWAFRVDYTRLHQNNTTTYTASGATDALYLTNWFYQTNGVSQNPAATSVQSTWDFDLDWLDATMSRPFYQGKKFTVSPFGGLRASWISQTFDVEIADVLNFGGTALDTSTSHNKLTSWAIGPRVGMEGRFLMGAGFRLQGNVGASLLFTKYDRVSHSENGIVPTNPTVSYFMDDYTCLRPMLEANLGLGWGMYVFNNNAHIDLSATYDFNYLWGQNMMGTLNEINILGNSNNGFDLSLQGLTVSAQFHF